MPNGAKVAIVDYDKPDTVVDALKDQDALIITLSFWAPRDAQDKLIQAAADAAVPCILPNEWAPDTAHEGLTRDISTMSEAPTVQEKIRKLGKSSFIAVVCGLWYECCLAIPALYGIDTFKKEATLFDDGEVKINTTTWPQIGRAVANLLSLPVKSVCSEDLDACLEHFQNGYAYISSFTVSQREMLASVFRVTGTSETEWKISKQPVREHFASGFEARERGDMEAGRMVYGRVFFDDEAGNFEKRKGLANALLALPKEDIDKATKVAVEWREKVEN